MLVAKGYYDDTFVHISQMMAITKAIIVVAALKCQFLHQMNFKNASLRGELQEDMYIDELCEEVNEILPFFLEFLETQLQKSTRLHFFGIAFPSNKMY